MFSTFADLFEPCLVPTCLARDTEPCARSVAWSQQGFAPNSGYEVLADMLSFSYTSCRLTFFFVHYLFQLFASCL